MSGMDRLTDELLGAYAAGKWKSYERDNIAMARELLAHRRASQAAPANWQDDPAADDRWCAGNDFALSRLCAVLKVNPDLVDWDGSDNSLQDEADALIMRILNAQAAPAPSDELREAFIAGAMAVHSQWLHAIEQGETPPRGDPEFGEAADDYCAALSIPTPAPSDALREALEPFAKAADIKLCGEWRDDQSISRTDVAFSITFGDLRRARAALSTPTEGAMRMETGMEHIARDIREGRFPERSEPQMRTATPAEERHD